MVKVPNFDDRKTINMKLIYTILLFFGCLYVNAQKGVLIQSRWQSGNKISESDYQLIPRSGLNYIISNDRDNVYIDIKVQDQTIQEKILNNGLTVWINMDDKPRRSLGIRYPMGALNPVTSRKGAPEENKINSDNTSAGLLSMANTIEIIGFISEPERHFPAENFDSFRGSVKIEKKGILYYKMVLPLSKLPVRNSKDGNGAMPFTIGFEFGFVPRTNLPENNNKPGSDSYWLSHVRLATSG